MFSYKYNQSKIKKSNEQFPKVKTTLNVKFRFKDEIAIKDRRETYKRLYTDFVKNNLGEYLKHVENLFPKPSVKGGYIDKKYGRKSFVIKNKKLKLGLDIKVESVSSSKPEELLNMIGLDNFILTGEYPDFL